MRKSLPHFKRKAIDWLIWQYEKNIPVKWHKTLAWFRFVLQFLFIYFIKQTKLKKLHKRQFIVISLIEHLGDIVASEPISRYIRQTYPDAYIFWCVRKPFRELIDHNPNIDKTVIIYCLTEWILLKDSGLFDMVVDLHFHGRDCPSCRIPLEKIFSQREVGFNNYLCFNLLKAFCNSANLPDLDEPPRVYIPIDVEHKVNSFRLPQNFIVLHCLSNMANKDWLIPNWQKLVQEMVRQWGLAIVEIGTKSALNKMGFPGYIDLTNRTSILETAEVIKRSQLFIGVESGPAHMANAVGAKSLVLISQFAHFKKCHPYTGNFAKGINSELIYEESSVADIPVEKVYAAAKRVYCFNHQINECYNPGPRLSTLCKIRNETKPI